MMRPLAPLLLAACGYTFVGDRGMPRGEEGSLPAIALEPFENRTFRRGLEIRLSTFLGDELRGRGAAPAERRDQAAWVLSGEVLEATERVLSEDRQDEIRESSFIVTVSVLLVERATEKNIGSYSFTETESFSARAGRVATLEDAEEEALRNMAERIVYWLEDKSGD
jgi:hypothetical protein